MRRLAHCLEQDKPLKIQIAGERITVPAKAILNIEQEPEGKVEAVEFNSNGTWIKLSFELKTASTGKAFAG